MDMKKYLEENPELKPPKPIYLPTYMIIQSSKISEWRRKVQDMNEKIEDHLKREEG